MTFKTGNFSAFSIIHIQFLKFKDCEKDTKFEKITIFFSNYLVVSM